MSAHTSYPSVITVPWTKVRTTTAYPLPALIARHEILTPRLLLRPPSPADFEAWRALRLQPAVMANMMEGVPDSSIEYSRAVFDSLLPPNDVNSYMWLIFERETGKFVGQGGVNKPASMYVGWPLVSFSFVEECWGRGYATELMAALLEAWWKLPRRMVEKEAYVPAEELDGVRAQPAGKLVPAVQERVCGMVWPHNLSSGKVLQKSGFEVLHRFFSTETQGLRMTCWSCHKPQIENGRVDDTAEAK
jgi:RimJ/RimL family protein N-acetyltransferase